MYMQSHVLRLHPFDQCTCTRLVVLSAVVFGCLY